MTTAFDWKDGEYQYCMDLIREGGNSSVPNEAIGSYLDVQIVSANKDKRYDVIAALQTLKVRWEEGRQS